MNISSSSRPPSNTLPQNTWRNRNALYIRRGIANFTVALPFLAFLPATLAYSMARVRGDWIYSHNKSESEEVMQNLESVLGNELSTEERARVTREWFRLASCIELDRLRLGQNRLEGLVTMRGLEYIEDALAKGRGAILCSAHFGSYQCCFSLLGAHGFPVTMVGRWDKKDLRIHTAISKLFTQKQVERFMRRPTIQPLPGGISAAAQSALLLRKNELVGMFLDAAPIANPSQAVPVDFLNRRIRLLPGAIVIAKLTGAPILMTFMRRCSDYTHQVLQVYPPVSMDGDTNTVFRRCVAVIESAVRNNPAYWNFWRLNSLHQLGILDDAVNGSITGLTHEIKPTH